MAATNDPQRRALLDAAEQIQRILQQDPAGAVKALADIGRLLRQLEGNHGKARH